MLVETIQKNSKLSLVAIFVVVSLSIFFKSLTNVDGCLSPDSCNYLMLAQNLLDKNSFFINTIDGEKLFAVWPVGYPFLIFLVSKITGLSVFLASKVLNILIIAIIFYLFHRLFKDDAWIFGMIFLTSEFLEVFSYSWSEVPFVLGIFWFTLALINYCKTDSKYLLHALNVLFAALFLFLTRYIGAFSVGVVGLFAVYLFFKKEYKKAFLLSIPLAFVTLFIALYLYNNMIHSGYPTGMPRIKAPESYLELFVMTIRAFLGELNLMRTGVDFYSLKSLIVFSITFIFQIFILYLFFYKHKPFVNTNNFLLNTDLKKIVLIGLLYYVSIIFMRWRSHFDELSFRLLIPGTFLILIGGITYLKNILTRNHFNNFTKAILIVIIVGYAIEMLRPSLKALTENKPQMTYYKNIEILTNQIREIPVGSIVIFPKNHFAYLRLDLLYTTPRYKPYYEIQDKWDDFLLALKQKHPDKAIYAFIPTFNNPTEELEFKKRYDETVYNFVLQNKGKTFVRLN